MNPWADDFDDMEEVYCENCEGKWLVPYYEELPDIGHPRFCCFCGIEFNYAVEDIDD